MIMNVCVREKIIEKERKAIKRILLYYAMD